MFEELKECKICPNNCKVNRIENKVGICKANDKIKIALASLHFFEEPCISGEKGSGTVFFSNCNLKCKFCQKYKISDLGNGKEITIEELADTFLELQTKGANNINLVTPTIYAYQIIEVIKIAKNKPIVIVMDIHCIRRHIREIENIPGGRSEFLLTVDMIRAAARKNINERVAMSSIYRKQLVMLRISSLDHRYYSFNAEIFLHDICFFHCCISPLCF